MNACARSVVSWRGNGSGGGPSCARAVNIQLATSIVVKTNQVRRITPPRNHYIRFCWFQRVLRVLHDLAANDRDRLTAEPDAVAVEPNAEIAAARGELTRHE